MNTIESQYNNFGYWLNVTLNNVCAFIPKKSPAYIKNAFDVPVKRKQRSDAFSETQIQQLIVDIHPMLIKDVLEKDAYAMLKKLKRLPVARRGNVMGAPTFHRYYYEYRIKLGLKRPTKTDQIIKLIREGKTIKEIVKVVGCGESTFRQIYADFKREQLGKY